MFDREQSPFDPLFTLKEVKAQEEKYRFDKFDTGCGILLGKTLIELAEETGLPIAFKIKLNGLVIFQYMPEGTGRFNELWLDKKLYTVETMKESTMAVWINATEMGLKRSFQEMVPSSDLVMCGGGSPQIHRTPIRATGVHINAGFPLYRQRNVWDSNSCRFRKSGRYEPMEVRICHIILIA